MKKINIKEKIEKFFCDYIEGMAMVWNPNHQLYLPNYNEDSIGELQERARKLLFLFRMLKVKFSYPDFQNRDKLINWLTEVDKGNFSA